MLFGDQQTKMIDYKLDQVNIDSNNNSRECMQSKTKKSNKNYRMILDDHDTSHPIDHVNKSNSIAAIDYVKLDDHEIDDYDDDENIWNLNSNNSIESTVSFIELWRELR